MDSSEKSFSVASLNIKSPLNRTLSHYNKAKLAQANKIEEPETTRANPKAKKILSPIITSKPMPERTKPSLFQELEAQKKTESEFPKMESKPSSDAKVFDMKRINNPRLARLIESSIDQFGFKKQQTAVMDPFDDRKSESDSAEESTETVDNDEFLSKKQEILDVKKELALRQKCSLEQRDKILKLMFDTNMLKARVQNPTDVR